MVPLPLAPKKLQPLEQTKLQILWNNEEEFHLDYFELRCLCPCASCVNENTGKRTLDRNSIQKDVKPKSIELRGRYAICVFWSDGHDTGMFHFDRLYEICKKFGLKIN